MKTLIVMVLAAGCTLYASTAADAGSSALAEWNFNDPTSLEASAGTGLIRLLGGVVATNFLGSSSDPEKPNGALSLKGFPAQGGAAGTAGLELATSAMGWRNLGLRFEVRASATASRRLRVLVATDEGEFVEAGSFEIPKDGEFVPAEFDLSSQTALNGAALVTVRLVSDFADGTQYQGVKSRADGSNSYSPVGTWRFDRIALVGEPGDGPPERLAIQVALVEDQIELLWPEVSEATCTVWRAATPAGPWESVAAELWESRHAEPLDAGPRYFQVTSP